MSMPKVRMVGLILAAALVQACSATPTGDDALSSRSEELAARPGEEVVLQVGATAVYASEGISVTYLRLVGDSRCPMEALCVWEGDAQVLLRIARNGAATVDASLHTHAGMGPRLWESGAWTLELVRVDPYPSVNVVPDPAKSRVALRLVPRGS